MSASQYKKLLSVAETILSKLDLPQETFDKYNEFKERVLEEGSTDAAELVCELQTDLLTVHQQFLKACADMLTSVLHAGSTPTSLEERLELFAEAFARKKKAVREAAALHADRYTLEGRMAVQRLADSLDDLEADFDRVVGVVGTVAEAAREKENAVTNLEEELQKAKKEIEDRMEMAKESQVLSTEYKALVRERDLLVERIQKKESEVTHLAKEMESMEKTLSLKIESLSTSHRQSLRSAQEYERSFERLIGFFRGVVPKPQSEVFKSRNLAAILDFMEDFIEQTISSDSQLKEKIRLKEASVDELQSKVCETERQVSTYMDDIKRLIAESNRCMEDLDQHASVLHQMRSSFVSSSSHSVIN